MVDRHRSDHVDDELLGTTSDSMNFDDIEECLGADVVADVQSSVRRAFVASREAGNANGQDALEQLLIAMLVSVVQPNKDFATAKRYVQHFQTALTAIQSEREK